LGLGSAYLHGFSLALKRDYDFVFEMDSDFSHNPDDLALLLSEGIQGKDLVIGSRYIGGIRVNNWPFRRLLLSKFANLYAGFILRTGITDMTSGFRCYSSRALRGIDLSSIRSKGYAFQVEMAYKVFKNGFCIKEVPIIFSERFGGTSKMSAGIKLEAFFSVLMMKIRKHE
jgi:dolichol-phosphate mannosyltransferase